MQENLSKHYQPPDEPEGDYYPVGRTFIRGEPLDRGDDIEAMLPYLTDPRRIEELLTPEEREIYRSNLQSVVDARRAAPRDVGDTYII